MLVSSTIWVLILAIVPIILYSYLIYYLVPVNFISKHRARRYLITGLLSPSLISLFYFIFPYWDYPQSTNVILAFIIYAIVQIGILEESAKYATFWWVSKERKSEKYDLPIAVMFYAMMSSVGFAITENIYYLIKLQKGIINLQSVFFDTSKLLANMAWQRSMVAVVAHMICGVIMGYFLAKAHEITYNCQTYSLVKKINRYKTIAKGIFFAALFHGIFDLNLMLPENPYQKIYVVIILAFGLIIGHFMIKELIQESIIKRSKQIQIKEKDETDK